VSENPSVSLIPTLKKLLDDPVADVREEAVDALASYRDPAARLALRRALTSEDPKVRRRAAEALGERQMTRRMILGAIALSAIVVTAGGAAVVARVSEPAPAVQANEPVQPGPDSTRVATLLNTLRSGDQLICELVVDRLRNNWWDNGDDGVGRFADDRTKYDASRTHSEAMSRIRARSNC
jgi:hypothetical protein